MTSQEPQNVDWQKFVAYPFSLRTRNFFHNANITKVYQLTLKSEEELRLYRNVGHKSVMEIRVALARFGLNLKGDQPLPPKSGSENLESLLREQIELEGRLREIKQRIDMIETSKPDKLKIAPVVFARWLELKDFDAVAKEFSITASKVRGYVSGAYLSRLKNGDINECDIMDCWKTKQNYSAVAEQHGIPEYLVRNIVVRLNR